MCFGNGKLGLPQQHGGRFLQKADADPAALQQVAVGKALGVDGPAGGRDAVKAVGGNDTQPQLRQQQMVQFFVGEQGTGTADDMMPALQGGFPQSGKQLSRCGPAGVLQADQPGTERLQCFVIQDTPPVSHGGKQPPFLCSGAAAVRQLPRGKAVGIAGDLLLIQRRSRQLPHLSQQGCGAGQVPYGLPVQPCDLLPQRNDGLPGGRKLRGIPTVTQRKRLFHRAGELRLQRVGRGSVQQDDLAAGQHHTVQAVGVGGAVDLLHRVAAPCRRPDDLFHQGGFAGAGPALDEDAPPACGGAGELREQRKKALPGIAPEKIAAEGCFAQEKDSFRR